MPSTRKCPLRPSLISYAIRSGARLCPRLADRVDRLSNNAGRAVTLTSLVSGERRLEKIFDTAARPCEIVIPAHRSASASSKYMNSSPMACAAGCLQLHDSPRSPRPTPPSVPGGAPRATPRPAGLTNAPSPATQHYPQAFPRGSTRRTANPHRPTEPMVGGTVGRRTGAR